MAKLSQWSVGYYNDTARAAGHADSSVHAEAAQLLGRRDDVAQKYRDEVTARDRSTTDIQQRSRDRSLSRDDGLEL